MKKLKAVETNKKTGETTFNLHATAADVDWLYAGRLKERADKGDEAAAKELKEMEETEMMSFTSEEMEHIRKTVELKNKKA